MDKLELIKTATKLKQVGVKSATEYGTKKDYLVELMNKLMADRTDILALVGEGNLDMMKDNNANHARFLESIFIQHSPEILVDTVLWVFRAYRSRKFSPTYWAAQLNSWIEVYKKELSPECYKEIYPYYNWMQINIPAFNQLAEDILDTPNSKQN